MSTSSVKNSLIRGQVFFLGVCGSPCMMSRVQTVHPSPLPQIGRNNTGRARCYLSDLGALSEASERNRNDWTFNRRSSYTHPNPQDLKRGHNTCPVGVDALAVMEYCVPFLGILETVAGDSAAAARCVARGKPGGWPRVRLW